MLPPTSDGCVYGGRNGRSRPIYEGMLKEEMDAAAARHPAVAYRPTLIDAAYAGLLTESGAQTLVVPALNRDGDCLSDLVLALFGRSPAPSLSCLALDDALEPVVAMAEAPHGTAPSLYGKNVANPMAMLWPRRRARSCGAEATSRWPGLPAPSARPRSARHADGVRTFDLGGEASTSEVVDEVIRRVRAGELGRVRLTEGGEEVPVARHPGQHLLGVEAQEVRVPGPGAAPTSSSVTGVETIGWGIARTEYTQTVVLAGWFWLQSIRTRPRLSSLRMTETIRSWCSDSS